MQTSTEYAKKNNWEEVQAPELIKLEKAGDEIAGILLDLRNETIMDNGKPRQVLTYRMELASEPGKQVKLRPSFDLQQKIGRRHIGRTMLIVYDSDLDTGKDSKMKIFKVFLKPVTEGDSEPPFVATDADLPDF